MDTYLQQISDLLIGCAELHVKQEHIDSEEAVVNIVRHTLDRLAASSKSAFDQAAIASNYKLKLDAIRNVVKGQGVLKEQLAQQKAELIAQKAKNTELQEKYDYEKLAHQAELANQYDALNKAQKDLASENATLKARCERMEKDILNWQEQATYMDAYTDGLKEAIKVISLSK